MMSSMLLWVMGSQSYPFMVFSGAILLITIVNYLYMPKLQSGPVCSPKRLSMLVPARNEEHNIANCLLSLVNQDHPNYEVIVLNDNSTDRTGEIVKNLAAEHPQIRVIDGGPLPDGWRGKNWACWQLSKAASGDVLLFTDADTVHSKGSGIGACRALESTGAGLVSGMVRQRMHTIGELLLVPLMNWAMMCFMPLPLAHMRQNLVLPAACGQYMAFSRNSYDLIGGHKAIRSHVLDDAELARAIRKAGQRSLLFDATDSVSCRMYSGFSEAVSGFTKNLFYIFQSRVIVHLFVWIWLLSSAVIPILYLIFGNEYRFLVPAAAQCVMMLVAWLIAFRKARVPVLLAMAYPIMMPLWFWLAMRSMVKVLRGSTVWKGRNLGKGHLKA